MTTIEEEIGTPEGVQWADFTYDKYKPESIKKQLSTILWNTVKQWDTNHKQMVQKYIDADSKHSYLYQQRVGKYNDQIEQTRSVIKGMENSCYELIDWMSENIAPPQKIICIYQQRGLSMTRDYGRGLDYDIQDKAGLHVNLTFEQKEKLILLSTPTIYIQRLNQIDDPNDTEYSLRVADHKEHRNSIGSFTLPTATVEGVIKMQLIVDKNGKIDKFAFDQIKETLLIRINEQESNDSYLLMER